MGQRRRRGHRRELVGLLSPSAHANCEALARASGGEGRRLLRPAGLCCCRQAFRCLFAAPVGGGVCMNAGRVIRCKALHAGEAALQQLSGS